MADAWGAVSATASGKHYGTSQADIKAYAQTGGAVAGGAAAAAACSATVVGAAAASFCAGLGAEVGAAVAGIIVDLGASIFGSDNPNINDQWNPVADHAINVLVNVARKAKGLPVTGAPGGSARNWPEWQGIAVQWARAANASATARGSKIVWWYEDPPDKAGRIRGEAMDQFWNALGHGMPGKGRAASSLTFTDAGNALRGLSQDVVTATEKTGVGIAAGSGSSSGSSSGSAIGTGSGGGFAFAVGALLLAGGGWWLWAHQAKRKR